MPGRLLFTDELVERAAAGSAWVTVHVSRPAGPAEVRVAGGPFTALSHRPGRVDADTLADAVQRCGGAEAGPGVFVCGPTSFVEAVLGLLSGTGLDPRSVRAERFG
jgi:ferredoxin-NADP reductase